MKPHGEIYLQDFVTHGEIKVSLTQFEKKVYKFTRLIGATFASLSLTSVLFFYGPAFLSNLDLSANQRPLATELPAAPVIPLSEIQIEEKPTIISQFSIEIAKINAYSEVIKDVDPFDQDEYEVALKKGVAHAKGTGLPGDGKRIYLFAHSTNSPLNFNQFNAVFYELRELEENDDIVIKLNDKEYKYAVTGKKVVSASDISWLTAETVEEELVLQTCDPPGTTLQRLLVFAKRV